MGYATAVIRILICVTVIVFFLRDSIKFCAFSCCRRVLVVQRKVLVTSGILGSTRISIVIFGDVFFGWVSY